VAKSKDLMRGERLGLILPAHQGQRNRGWEKSGVIVWKKIAGKYCMYWPGTAADRADHMGISRSREPLRWTEELDAPILPRRPWGNSALVWRNPVRLRWEGIAKQGERWIATTAKRMSM